MNLANKVAIITGGSSGIGGAIATDYAKAGMKIIITARSLEPLQKKKEELDKLGAETDYIQADVSNQKDVQRITKRAIDHFGKIDVLVNSAGISMASPAEELSLENWQRCLDINSTGTFMMCQEVGKEMIANKSGKIINITSIVAHAGIPNRVAYAASKGAVRQLTENLALDWGKHNIQVNSISPGYVSTPLFERLAEQGAHDKEALIARIPLGRLAKPEDIAGPACFLAAEESDYVTGVILKVDGGWLVNGHLDC